MELFEAVGGARKVYHTSRRSVWVTDDVTSAWSLLANCPEVVKMTGGWPKEARAGTVMVLKEVGVENYLVVNDLAGEDVKGGDMY